MLLGKLCIGVLEEDNPQKSYFRLKPILIRENENYEEFTGGDEYPDDGCLRIVPDKNESGRFKSRMRRMGKYCLLDLRCHPTPNDKIRSNKNYGANSSERNTHIVYSDVVREPGEGMILEIASDTADESVTTSQVLIGDGCEIYRTVLDASGEASYLAPDGTILSEDEIRRFEIKGPNDQILRFAVRLSEAFIPAPLRQIAGPAAQPQTPAAPVLPETPEAQPIQSAEQPPEINAAPAEAIPAEAAVPTAEPVSPEQNTPVTSDRTHVRRMLSSQAGLNPRGRMSLQEIIDEKWCRSRYDQLGHPVPGAAMGQPVESPVDSAVRAIRTAWENPETRRQLSDTILEMHDVAEDLEHTLRTTHADTARRVLEDLEAERLMALTEIDRLRKDKTKLRETFKAEIREDEAAAFADAVTKTKQAQDRLAALNRQIESAADDANAVRDVLASLNDGRFENELRNFALRNRCMEVLTKMTVGDPCPARLPEVTPDRSEWMDRIHTAFAAKGLPLNDIEAANMLICAALGSKVILSGPPSADGKLTVQAIADALGAASAKRFLQLDPDPMHPLPPHIDAELRKTCDVPGILLIRNANLTEGYLSRETDTDSGYITVIEVSDTGAPVVPETLKDGWFIRLSPLSADAPWHIEGGSEPQTYAPASYSSLRKAVLENPVEIPAALSDRLQFIRNQLAIHGATLSRSTLDDMWKYCGAIMSMCRISAGEALDRAFAQRALPHLLATASLSCLKEIGSILDHMPITSALLKQPLPIQL